MSYSPTPFSVETFSKETLRFLVFIVVGLRCRVGTYALLEHVVSGMSVGPGEVGLSFVSTGSSLLV